MARMFSLVLLLNLLVIASSVRFSYIPVNSFVSKQLSGASFTNLLRETENSNSVVAVKWSSIEQNPIAVITAMANKAFTIFRNGFVDFYRNHKRVRELKKLLKLHKGDRSVLSYSDYKLLERYEQDIQKAIRTAIFIPFAFEFFLYSSILFPILTMNNNLWAFVNQFPSTFDTTEDRLKREQLIYQRRLSSFYTAILAQYKELNENQFYPSSQSRVTATKENMKIISTALSQYLQKGNLEQALQLLQPFYRNEMISSSRKKMRTSLTTTGLSHTVVKELCRAIGREGMPNIPILRSFNRKELDSFVSHLQKSDDYLSRHGLSDLTESELTQACMERGIGVHQKTPEKLRNELKNYLAVLSPNDKENQQNKRFVLFSLNVAKDIHDSNPFPLLSSM